MYKTLCSSYKRQAFITWAQLNVDKVNYTNYGIETVWLLFLENICHSISSFLLICTVYDFSSASSFTVFVSFLFLLMILFLIFYSLLLSLFIFFLNPHWYLIFILRGGA